MLAWWKRNTKVKPVETIETGWPDQDWINDHPAPENTWDLWKLERSEHQLLFVYDHLQSGHRSNQMLEGFGERVAIAYTSNPRFILWKKKLGQGSFPIPLRNPCTGIPQGRIKGELWKVRSSRYEDLDNFKLNGVEFRRKRTNLIVPYRPKDNLSEEFVQHCEAWMYFGRYTYWSDFIDAGYHFKPVTQYTPKYSHSDGIRIGNYYSFTQQEYSD